MSGFKKFAIVGAGNIGAFIVEELLKQKTAGAIDDVTIVTRPVSTTSVPLRFSQRTLFLSCKTRKTDQLCPRRNPVTKNKTKPSQLAVCTSGPPSTPTSLRLHRHSLARM
jgi:hypothetical protein